MVHGLISTLSYAAAGEASSRHKATSPPVQPVPTTQATPSACPNGSTTNDIVSQPNVYWNPGDSPMAHWQSS